LIRGGRQARYKRSESTLQDGSLGIGDYRTSVSAALPVNDPVVQCITQRAADLQGFMSKTDFEAFQVVQYTEGQKFDAHYDWYHNATQQNNTGRITSIFATLSADCTDCGTQFPHMLYDWEKEDPRLCEYVDCHRRELSVKPIEGNALFWRNLNADGSGDTRTLHAGLPLPRGTKVGLNIFARATIP
jgi:prolyl 4-hydroxylase